MSRIGKKPVDYPAGVTISVGTDNVVTVKGPKGELKQAVDRDIKLEVKDGTLELVRPTDQIRHKAMHGLYRSLVSNMVKGVTEGYTKQLELVGVGFKAASTGNILDLAFYGVVFGPSSEYDIAAFMPAEGGYAGFLKGHVVDMFYFPMFEGNFPTWFPIWGGEHFEFFNAIFNLADMAISFGVGIILVFQNYFFKTKQPIKDKTPPIEDSNN